MHSEFDVKNIGKSMKRIDNDRSLPHVLKVGCMESSLKCMYLSDD